MPAVSTILASIALAGALGGGAIALSQSNKAQKRAAGLAKDEARRVSGKGGLIEQFEEKTNPAAKKAEQKKVGGEARRRQSILARQAVGRRSTILTGPLGLTEEPESKGKVLLGL